MYLGKYIFIGKGLIELHMFRLNMYFWFPIKLKYLFTKGAFAFLLKTDWQEYQEDIANQYGCDEDDEEEMYN